MINLLPQKNKKKLKKDILRRFIVVGGLGFSGLVLVVIILSFASYSHMSTLVQGFSEQLRLTKNLAVLKNLEELEFEVKETNVLISSLSQDRKDMELITDDLDKVLNIQPHSIKTKGFLFECGNKEQKQPSKMMVSGNALTRKSLLNFIDDLKSSGQFKSVISPISNLLEESDVDFTLSIELK